MRPEVHTYRCSFCGTTATSTIRITQPPLKCVLCLRFMAFKYSSPVTQAEWNARNLNPPTFYTPHEVSTTPYTKRACDTCRAHVERGLMVILSGVGKFCSEDCAQVGVLQHQQFMERLSKVKEEMPWLR